MIRPLNARVYNCIKMNVLLEVYDFKQFTNYFGFNNIVKL